MTGEVSFLYVKSEGMDGPCEVDVMAGLDERSLEIIHLKDVFMNYIKLREHQPILFDIVGDLNDIWKVQGAARLMGTTVRTMVVGGDQAIEKTADLKAAIRSKYALPCEFDREREMSFPNFVHAADNRPQVDHDIKILVPEQLEFVRSVNGVHEMVDRIW